MEILNNIWVALTTENTTIINIMLVLFLFIEMPLTMELFLTILNITATKKQKLIYLALTIPIGIVCVFLISKPYSNIITLISAPIIIMCVFKISFLKSLVAEFIPIVFISILEMIFARLFLIIFNMEYSVLLLFKVTINILDNISKRNKRVILLNILFALIVVFMQMYLIGYYNDKLPLFIIIIDILSIVVYFLLSIYSMVKTMKLEKVEEDLEQEKLYNKTLQILHDNIRAFKHDFANIVSGIGGYVDTNDMEGLRKYYKQLLQDCKQVSNLGSLNPEVINSPSVYSVLANKYYRADSLGIKINLDSFIDFKNLNMGIYEFTRIGLWEVDRIIKKHKNLARFTSKNEEFFKQQIEIYNE